MTDADIGRIQKDLDTIRQALQAEPAFSKADVWQNLITAAIGVTVGCVTASTGVATLVDGGPNLWYVALVLGAALAVLLSIGVIAVRHRGESPSFFQYSWKSMLAATIASVVYLAFSAWAFRAGLSLGTLAITTVFCAGVFQLVSTFCEGWNPGKFSWGITFACMAFFLPLGTYETAGLLAGVFLTAGGLLAALLTEIQLRKSTHAAD